MPQRTGKRVGLIGFGTIGRTIGRIVTEEGSAAVDFVLTRNPLPKTDLPAGAEHVTDLISLPGRDVDLVVEAVDADYVRDHASLVLEHADLMTFSLTAFADDAVRERVREAGAGSGRRLYVPHGGILGLDGIHDGRAVIESVVITTTKHPGNLGLDETEEGTVFHGTAREAARRFPRNVNVHAAVALAGIGFDATRSRIVADASSRRMRHEIVVRGTGIAWDITVESYAAGAVSSAYTPESAARTVQRVLGGTGGIVLA